MKIKAFGYVLTIEKERKLGSVKDVKLEVSRDPTEEDKKFVDSVPIDAEDINHRFNKSCPK